MSRRCGIDLCIRVFFCHRVFTRTVWVLDSPPHEVHFIPVINKTCFLGSGVCHGAWMYVSGEAAAQYWNLGHQWDREGDRRTQLSWCKKKKKRFTELLRLKKDLWITRKHVILNTFLLNRMAAWIRCPQRPSQFLAPGFDPRVKQQTR